MKAWLSACLVTVVALVSGCTPAANPTVPPVVSPTPTISTPSVGTPSASPRGTVVTLPVNASFRHGYTTRWTYQTGPYASVVQSDSTWVVVASPPEAMSDDPDVTVPDVTVVTGLDAATGEQLWQEQLPGQGACAADLFDGNVACVLDENIGTDDNPQDTSKLTLVDPRDGRVVKSVDVRTLFPSGFGEPKLCATGDCYGGASLQVVDGTLIVNAWIDLNSEDVPENSITARVSPDLSVMWTTKPYVSYGGNAVHWHATVRMKSGILLYVDTGSQFALDVSTGALIRTGDVVDLFGADTLVAYERGKYALPAGGTKRAFDWSTVWFPASTETPPYPIAYLPIPTPKGITVIGAVNPATKKTLWTKFLTAKENPGNAGTFTGAFRDGVLILVDSSGQVYRVDPRTGRVAWHVHYSGFVARESGNAGTSVPAVTILTDGTVVVLDWGEDDTFLVAFDPDTGKQVWKTTGDIGFSQGNDMGGVGMSLAPFGPSLASLTGTDTGELLSRLDPVAP